MARALITIVFLLLGIALIGLGASWKALFPPDSFWNEKKADEYLDAYRTFKAAGSREGRRATDVSDPLFVAAKAQYERLQSDLDQAVARRNYAGIVLIAVGFALLASSAAVHLQGKALDKAASAKR